MAFKKERKKNQSTFQDILLGTHKINIHDIASKYISHI